MTGRIIKASEMVDRQLARYNPDDALRSVTDKIEAANSQLRQERERAENEVSRIHQEAMRKGYEEGFEQGSEESRAQQEAQYGQKLAAEVATRCEPLAQMVEALVTQWESIQKEWLKSWEQSAVEIVCSIASRVARKVVEADSTTIQRTMGEILGLIAGSSKARIHLHPEDLESIQLPSNALGAYVADRQSLELVTDPAVGRGGCRVETEFSTIDASIETQISRLLAEITSDPTISRISGHREE